MAAQNEIFEFVALIIYDFLTLSITIKNLIQLKIFADFRNFEINFENSTFVPQRINRNNFLIFCL